MSNETPKPCSAQVPGPPPSCRGRTRKGLACGLAPLLLASLLPACRCPGEAPAGDARSKPAVVVVDPEEVRRPPATAELEPNDTREAAQRLGPGEWIEGTLAAGKGSKGDLDWYRVNADQNGQVLKATITGVSGLDLALEAYNEAGKRLVKVDNSQEGGGEVLVNLGVDRGVYYLRASESQGRPGSVSYRVSYSVRAREEGEEVEPNWKAALATPLTLDSEAVGYLGWYTDNDWYRVEAADLSAESRVQVELDGVDGVSANLSVRDDASGVISERWSGQGQGVLLSNLVLGGGKSAFYVVVRSSRAANVENRYFLRVMAAVPPGPTEAEPNDRPEQATLLQPGQPMRGILGDTRDRDIFRLAGIEGEAVGLTVSPPMGVDLAVSLLDLRGKEIWKVNAAGVREPEVVPGIVLGPRGALLLVTAPKVDPISASAPYSLDARALNLPGLEKEPNDRGEGLEPWPEARWPIQGFIYPPGDMDCYAIPVVASPLRVSLTGPRGTSLSARLTDAEGAQVMQASTGLEGGPAALSAEVLPGQRVLLCISDPAGKSSASQSYSLTRENP